MFEWILPRRVFSGAGAIRQLPDLAVSLGRCAFVVCGSHPERILPVLDSLSAAGISLTLATVGHEPTDRDIRNLLEQARTTRADLVISVGGGSVVDAGKAVAGLVTNPADLEDYLEVVGRGQPLKCPPLPFIAVPTTAGTGSEATRNAVIEIREQRVKVSLRSPLLVPQQVILDPELTVTLPRAQTLASGFDAFVQLLEAFVSRKANPLTDAVCREGLRLALKALPRVLADGQSLDDRADMQHAAFFSGVALANAGLGAVHGFAGPLGGLLGAPHGALCAALLLPVAKVNISALCARARDSVALQRYAEVAVMATGEPEASPQEFLEWLRDFVERLGVPRLRDLGMISDLIDVTVEKAREASSMKANPIELTEEELRSVLIEALN